MTITLSTLNDTYQPANFPATANSAVVIFGLDGADTILSGAFADTIYGDDALFSPVVPGVLYSDVIEGNSGDDVIFGNYGSDTINGGDGNEIINGNIESDLINGGNGLDIIYGGQGNDSINGNDDSDQLFGNLGDDSLQGNNGDDVMAGNQGSDSLLGGAGNDTLFGGADNDAMVGDSGDDFLSGDRGDDYLIGEAGADTLYGQEGADTMFSGSGNDILDGGFGTDIIHAGTENDVITLFGDSIYDIAISGGGRDKFIFGGLWGNDIIVDFDPNAADLSGADLLVILTQGGAGTTYGISYVDVWNENDNTFSSDGVKDAVIDILGQKITLAGVTGVGTNTLGALSIQFADINNFAESIVAIA
jgi:Ca2+-binding RTX toxin-like protein